MTLALACAALRRHPFSLVCTALLAGLSASLLGLPVPTVLLVWIVTSLLILEAWHAIEPFVLLRLGCRLPNRLERERLDAAAADGPVEILVVDTAEPWHARGFRCLVVSRGLFDLLEDRALAGMLTQAGAQIHSARLAGEVVVWLGNPPLICAWGFSRCLMHLGRLLAVLVGSSLVLPMLLWPEGVTRWGGRLFGSAIGGLLGAALLSNGMAAAGLGLLLAWVVVPGLEGLLDWESRRVETVADRATIEAGLGWQLLEALETLTWAESLPTPGGLLGLLSRAGAPLASRADRIWQALSQSAQKGGTA
jgi:hypothetical protein